MKSGSYLISDMLIKLFALALTGTLTGVLLKKHCREILPFFEIAVVIAAVIILADADPLKNNSLVKLISRYSQVSEAFRVIVKGAAVTVLTKLACDICRESGNALMADIVELGGRLMLITLAVPFIEKIFETALSFAG